MGPGAGICNVFCLKAKSSLSQIPFGSKKQNVRLVCPGQVRIQEFVGKGSTGEKRDLSTNQPTAVCGQKILFQARLLAGLSFQLCHQLRTFEHFHGSKCSKLLCSNRGKKFLEVSSLRLKRPRVCGSNHCVYPPLDSDWKHSAVTWALKRNLIVCISAGGALIASWCADLITPVSIHFKLQSILHWARNSASGTFLLALDHQPQARFQFNPSFEIPEETNKLRCTIRQGRSHCNLFLVCAPFSFSSGFQERDTCKKWALSNKPRVEIYPCSSDGSINKPSLERNPPWFYTLHWIHKPTAASHADMVAHTCTNNIVSSVFQGVSLHSGTKAWNLAPLFSEELIFQSSWIHPRFSGAIRKCPPITTKIKRKRRLLSAGKNGSLETREGIHWTSSACLSVSKGSITTFLWVDHLPVRETWGKKTVRRCRKAPAHASHSFCCMYK